MSQLEPQITVTCIPSSQGQNVAPPSSWDIIDLPLKMLPFSTFEDFTLALAYAHAAVSLPHDTGAILGGKGGFLLRMAATANSEECTGNIPFISQHIYLHTPDWLPEIEHSSGWATSTSRDSSARRSAITNEALLRDLHFCVLTNNRTVDVAHIVPFAIPDKQWNDLLHAVQVQVRALGKPFNQSVYPSPDCLGNVMTLDKSAHCEFDTLQWSLFCKGDPFANITDMEVHSLLRSHPSPANDCQAFSPGAPALIPAISFQFGKAVTAYRKASPQLQTPSFLEENGFPKGLSFRKPSLALWYTPPYPPQFTLPPTGTVIPLPIFLNLHYGLFFLKNYCLKRWVGSQVKTFNHKKKRTASTTVSNSPSLSPSNKRFKHSSGATPQESPTHSFPTVQGQQHGGWNPGDSPMPLTADTSLLTSSSYPSLSSISSLPSMIPDVRIHDTSSLVEDAFSPQDPHSGDVKWNKEEESSGGMEVEDEGAGQVEGAAGGEDEEDRDWGEDDSGDEDDLEDEGEAEKRAREELWAFFINRATQNIKAYTADIQRVRAQEQTGI